MKKIITTILMFILLVFVVLIVCSQIVKNKKEENTTTTNIITQAQTLYILSDYDGRLALFSSENQEPVTVYEIYTESLPYDDYILIKSGIKVKSEEELQRLIEDYLS